MGKPTRRHLRPALDSREVVEPSAAADGTGSAMGRRDFLAKGSATVAFLAAFQLGHAGARPGGNPGKSFDRFSYGVASGDPLPDRVIIWTRVNATPDDTPGSGIGGTVNGTWEVSLDPGFKRRVASGSFRTTTAQDHTVKIDVGGLEPFTEYFYRFHAKGATSPAGRTLTAPPAGSSPASVRFGMVSCSNFEAGYFTAYRHLAERDDLDFILHLGDYIYEYANGAYGPAGFAGVTRAHDPAGEIITLADYRRRHACYKADGDLRQLHAAHPFIAIWDDHESANNAWRDGAENHSEFEEGLWSVRKSEAIKAYYEWMPVRLPAATGSTGEVLPIYRRFAFGDLVDLLMLDLRQYRSEQPASPADGAVINDPARSILGPQQTQWLQANLLGSTAKWRLLGNSVQIAPVIVIPALLDPQTQALLQAFFGVPAGVAAPVPLNVDSWDGYNASRLAILGLIAGAAGRPVPNCVFLTGDIHSSYACEIPANPATYGANPVSLATEFVATSITSDNVNEIVGQPERIPDGLGGYISNPATAPFEQLIRAFNAWIKDVNLDFHGFSIVDVTPARTQVDNWVLRSDASPALAADPRIDPNAACVLRSSYQTISLTQRVSPAPAPLGARV
jgi:alkaline phosphatase D